MVVRLILVILMCAGASGAPRAHAQSSNEYHIKAAFLYNFAKFTEWPADAFPDSKAPIVLGVIGEDPFGDILEQTIKGKTANGRELAIQRPKRLQDLKGCHILFVSSSERKQLAQILGHLNGSSVLTVGEFERFAQLGGIINFTMEANKVRFEINVTIMERSRLKISSKLLTLAKIVKDEHYGGNH